MGSFETDIVLPDMKKVPLKMSSILLASMRVPAQASKGDKKQSVSPLVRGGAAVCAQYQPCFPAGGSICICFMRCTGRRKVKPVADASGVAPKVARGAINLVSSLELIQGSTKVF